MVEIQKVIKNSSLAILALVFFGMNVQVGLADTTWQATDSSIGHIVGHQDGSDWYATVNDPKGHMIYGPYIYLTRGNYKVTFRMKIDNNDANDDEVAILDITSDFGRNDIIADQRVTRRQFVYANTYQDFSAVFKTTKDYSNVEFRLYYKKTAKITVDYIKLESVSEGQTNKNVLFAHGFQADKSTWDHFASRAQSKGWNVMRTSVSKDGLIATRAKELADYINSANVPEGSIIAVGHSMGGLDLRYIVGEAYKGNEPYYSAAKKIRKIYTLGTPHRGSQTADLGDIEYCIPIVGPCIKLSDLFGGGALNDLKTSHMEQFNKDYPYDKFSVDGRHITLIAWTFDGKAKGGKACNEGKYISDSSCVWNSVIGAMGSPNDGVVETYNQEWPDAPKRGPDANCHCDNLNHNWELEEDWILDEILDDYWL